MRQVLTLILIVFSISSYAQVKDSTESKKKTVQDFKNMMSPYYSYGNGLGITSPDSLYQVNIRFRMQNRISYNHNDGEEDNIDGQIRRLRLRFDGYIGDPKFGYSMQLSFAAGDVGKAEEGKNTNIIRDAMIFYYPNKHWSLGFGQTKLPGNRQRVNSSGALQLTDRSINNADFNIDRDFGFQVLYNKRNQEKFSYILRGAISTGEGRNWTNFKDTGLAYTGKVELFPLGEFTKGGSNYEGDLVHEQTPKLMLSGAYSYNDRAHRTAGMLGDDIVGGGTANIKSLFLDAMLKYRGWNLMYSYMNRNSDNVLFYNPADISDFNYIYNGEGMDFQGSYTFPKHWEVIGRYSTQTVDKDIFEFTPNTNQFTLGLTKYIWEHAFKLQAEFTYEQQKFYNLEKKNNWYARFQIEIGI
ncbi:porin [Empedobacter falsenii]|uniref:porin n=1 Tax=Empedobacter TaxID=59734 RepID=UPI0024494D40|nr:MULTISPECIES: porin [Empedobacter]MDH1882539.1 OprO/OprP family phosphate-selective porin [Empedobacter sp. GD03797]MDM1041921.1 porin [Empedobacter brevis]MDM1135852.1 porin [Empedobacter sp. R750]